MITNTHILRFSTSAISEGLLTLALFYLMVMLITQKFEMPTPTKGTYVTIVKPLEMKPPIPLLPELVALVPPENPPPPPRTTRLTTSLEPGGTQIFEQPVKGGHKGMKFDLVDGGLLPLVSVQPKYPRQAARRSIEGYTIVEFDVSAQGLVTNPRIIDHQPNAVFDIESLKAIRKFKYQPEVINGEAVPRTNLLKRFTFKMNQG